MSKMTLNIVWKEYLADGSLRATRELSLEDATHTSHDELMQEFANFLRSIGYVLPDEYSFI